MPYLEASNSIVRVECARCGRPEVTCYCAHVSELVTRTRVLVLQHPRERTKAVGTARIAALCLPGAELAVGVDFTAHSRVRALLEDPARKAVLLYPSHDARDLASDPPRGDTTLVVIDGTWHQARSIVRKNPWLAALPRYALRPPRPSEYKIRREPAAHCVSTVEALAFALGALEGEPDRFDALLAPFRAMVAVQVGFAARSRGGRKRTKRRASVAAPPCLPEALCAPHLVCITGEANAFPYDRATRLPRRPHELVHWVAVRLSDGARFEAVVAPEGELSRSPMVHARLSEREVREGMSRAVFCESWASFVRPDDVLCSWGPYSCSLLANAGGVFPERSVDVRKIVGDLTRARPGSVEGQVAAQALPFRALGRGRGGERLGMLVAIMEALRGARVERA